MTGSFVLMWINARLVLNGTIDNRLGGDFIATSVVERERERDLGILVDDKFKFHVQQQIGQISFSGLFVSPLNALILR